MVIGNKLGEIAVHVYCTDGIRNLSPYSLCVISPTEHLANKKQGKKRGDTPQAASYHPTLVIPALYVDDKIVDSTDELMIFARRDDIRCG